MSRRVLVAELDPGQPAASDLQKTVAVATEVKVHVDPATIDLDGSLGDKPACLAGGGRETHLFHELAYPHLGPGADPHHGRRVRRSLLEPLLEEARSASGGVGTMKPDDEFGGK